MSRSDQVATVIIKADSDSNKISKHPNINLELIKDGSKVEIIIRNPIDAEIIRQYPLCGCSYLPDSSSEHAISFHVNSKQETVIIIAKDERCVNLFASIQKYFADSSYISEEENVSKTQNDLQEKVEQFVIAFNNGDVDTATRYAQVLANSSKNSSIHFYLDKIGEQEKSITNKLLKLQITIESVLGKSDNNPYEVIIRSHTSLRELKQKIYDQTGIPVNNQQWFLNRQILSDTYEFIDIPQSKTNNTGLFLYICKL
ncbi:unnamed protein product [Adineta steineri]|uniref:Ubiquitin-like domain-containing protein n=1 Tax=Adineta steineri TaxID=433720 RepID=A0A815JG99_9BILA|nr:unnamed protein product [Adineta steineri]CAF3616180.1 unnamed protein product [Adineta steineri]